MTSHSHPFYKGTILIVDDVPENLTLLNKILSIQGYKVRSALTGKLAVQSAIAKPPDLILLDILMPEMNGYAVCQALKSTQATCEIPVIFVSALSDAFDKVKAFSVGGADYLTKPIETHEAIARIENQLSISRLRKQLMQRNLELEQEIEARKHIEAALQQSLQEVKDIKVALDQAAIVSVTDLDGKITYANDQFCSVSKFSQAELIGQPHSIISSGYHPQEFFQRMWETIAQGKIWKGEIRNRTKTGQFYWVDAIIVPMLGPDGQPQQYISIRHDITDRNRATLDKLRAKIAVWHQVQAEEQLRLLQSVVVNANDSVVITKATPFDAPGPEIIYVNEAFTRITGYKAQEAVGRTPRILQGKKTSAIAKAKIREALESWSSTRVELLNYTKAGVEFWVDLNITPLTDEGGMVTHWIAIQRDISEKKKSELILQQQAQIIDQIHDSVVLTDLQGTITSWNRGAQQCFGYPAHEILDQHLSTICFEGQLEVNQQIICPLIEKGAYEVEIDMLTKSQKRFSAHLSLSILKDNQNRAIGMILYIIDISERKRAEAEILRSLNRERELNELKTRFVSMVSHEYRTPLATILSSLDLLEHYGHCSTEAEKQEFFQQVRTAIQRMTDLLNDVLILSKSESHLITCHPSPMDVLKFCTNLVSELQGTIKTQHAIEFIHHPETLHGQFDEKLLRHILSNLILNAVKYSPSQGIIKLEVIQDEQFIAFVVKDQGIGIPEESMQKLFQSFFRANNVGNIEGTGLGLSIVKRFVEIHGGRIEVESQERVGSIFRVILPTHDFQMQEFQEPQALIAHMNVAR